MNLVIAIFATPPELAYRTFNLIADAFRDKKAAHHVGKNGLNDSTYENTPPCKR
jgi:hypothetical protein